MSEAIALLDVREGPGLWQVGSPCCASPGSPGGVVDRITKSYLAAFKAEQALGGKSVTVCG
jgi:hypothetical protein